MYIAVYIVMYSCAFKFELSIHLFGLSSALRRKAKFLSTTPD